MGSENLKFSFINGVKWTTLSSIISVLLQLLQTFLIANYLSNYELGLYSLLITCIGFINIFSDIGISNSIIHFQSMNYTQYNTLYWINVAIGIFLMILGFILSIILIKLNINNELFNLLKIACVSFFTQSLGQQYQYYFQKKMMFKKISKINIIVKVISLLSLFIFLNCGYNIYSIVYSLILSSIIYSILYINSGKEFYKPALFYHISLSECNKMLNFGMFQMFERLLNFSSSNLDRFIISYFYGLNILGPYELAMQIITKPFGIINMIFNSVAYPIYSKLQNLQDELNKLYLDNIQILSFFIFPIYFGLFVTRHFYFPIIFPKNYLDVVNVFNFVWWLGLIYSIGNPLGTYLLALGKVRIGFLMNVIQFLVTFLLLTICSLSFEFKNMLIISSICITIIMLPIDFIIRKKLTNMNNWDFASKIAINLISSLMMGLIVYSVSITITNNQLVICIITGIFSYLMINYIINKSFLFKIIQHKI